MAHFSDNNLILLNRLFKYCSLFVFLNLGIFQLKAQLDSCILISQPNFEGTFFQENYLIDITPDQSGKLKEKPIEWVNMEGVSGWTPDIQIIVESERKLIDALRDFPPSNKLQEEHIDNIIQDFAKYKRQYIGFTDSLNNQCLWIKFYKADISLKSPEREVMLVFGGGTDYFTIWYSVSANKIIALIINSPI